MRTTDRSQYKTSTKSSRTPIRKATTIERSMRTTARALYQTINPHVGTSARALLKTIRGRTAQALAGRKGRKRRHALYREVLREHGGARRLYQQVMSGRFT